MNTMKWNSDKNFANQLDITITDLFPSLLLMKSFAKNRKLCHIFLALWAFFVIPTCFQTIQFHFENYYSKVDTMLYLQLGATRIRLVIWRLLRYCVTTRVGIFITFPVLPQKWRRKFCAGPIAVQEEKSNNQLYI